MNVREFNIDKKWPIISIDIRPTKDIKKGYERRQIVVQSELKGDRAYFFFFQDMKFLSCDNCCTLPQTLPHLKSGFQHSQMGFLIMFEENI